jgi:hypothetical protein
MLPAPDIEASPVHVHIPGLMLLARRDTYHKKSEISFGFSHCFGRRSWLGAFHAVHARTHARTHAIYQHNP